MIFPPAFLDSSSWNDNQHHQQQQQAHHQQVAANGGGNDGNNHELLQPSIMGGGALPEGGGGAGQQVGPAKPMSMAERARIARIPLPEPGLKCPRCDSTNTKFCYFNNYSLSQPRHFCRACRRYWTRGGALRNVPVGGGYRRHAKRAKPKPAAGAAPANSSATAPATAAAMAPAGTTSCTTTTNNVAAALGPGGHGMLGGGNLSMLPPLLRLADFDAMSLGSSCFSGMAGTKPPSSLDAGGYSVGPPGGLEQWTTRVQQQMQSFPFLHAMDHQGSLGPPLAMTMAPGMFQLGLDSAGSDGRGGGAGGEDGSGELHVMQAKREGYTARGNMYGDHHLAAAGYGSYSNNAATGNHLL